MTIERRLSYKGKVPSVNGEKYQGTGFRKHQDVVIKRLRKLSLSPRLCNKRLGEVHCHLGTVDALVK